MINGPLISIVLPVYNGAHYLQKSVQSVLLQDLQNFEFLILDDLSSDGSWEYLQSLNDTRIKLHRNETNKGLFYNLNWLITHTNSKLIKLWAQDDVMYPGCLRKFVDFHKEHPGLGFSYCARDIIDDNGNIITPKRIDNTPQVITSERHAKIAFITGSISGNIANVCINKDALEKVGLFKEEMKISADFDMQVRLARDHDTGFINERLIQLRDHKGQLSRNEQYYLAHVKEDLSVFRYLLSYLDDRAKQEGRIKLRNNKLVFYYTLMVKALLNGNISLAREYYKELAAFDDFGKLTVSFIRNKLFSFR